MRRNISCEEENVHKCEIFKWNTKLIRLFLNILHFKSVTVKLIVEK